MKFLQNAVFTVFFSIGLIVALYFSYAYGYYAANQGIEERLDQAFDYGWKNGASNQRLHDLGREGSSL